MASGTKSKVLRAIKSQIRGHYITTVTGTNYYADRRQEEYIFYTTSSKHKDQGDDNYYTTKFTARGLKR